MRATAIANQKGGVGKTTTVVNLAAALAAARVPTVVVDLDPQCNATEGLGVDPDTVEATAYEVLHPERDARVPLADALVPTRCGALLLAGHLALAKIEREGSGPGGERLLMVALGKAELPDGVVVLIDCPPSLGRLTITAFAAADDVIVPVSPGPDEIKGVARLLDLLEDMHSSTLNVGLRVAHVLLTSYDGRTRLSRDVERQLREAFPTEWAGTIAHTVQVGEATARQQSVLEYRPSSTAAQDYLAFARLYRRRGEDR